MWIHLDLIREIRQSVNDIFPVADYAFTTIPTYPCGQIGFVVASLDPKENLRKPLREVPECRYWSPSVHTAAFTLPEFARKVIEDGQQAPPRVIASGNGEATKRDAKKVLLLGSGYVARPFAEYITRYQEYSLTVSSSKQKNADKMAEGLPRTKALAVDVKNPKDLEAAVAAHDVVISLVPYIYHADVIKAAIKGPYRGVKARKAMLTYLSRARPQARPTSSRRRTSPTPSAISSPRSRRPASPSSTRLVSTPDLTTSTPSRPSTTSTPTAARSLRSPPTAVVFLPPRRPTIPSATSSRGPRVVSCSLCATRASSGKTEKSRPSPVST